MPKAKAKTQAQSLVKLKKGKRAGLKNSQTGKSGLGAGVIEEQGRILVMRPGDKNADSRNYVRLERAVVKAPPKKPVHHRDGNPKNNDPSNLKVESSIGAHNAERKRKKKVKKSA